MSIELDSKIHYDNISITLILRDSNDLNVCTLCSLDSNNRLNIVPGINVVTLALPALYFKPGPYTVDIGINSSITAPAWDVLCRVPLVEVMPPLDTADTSLCISGRSWGVWHIDTARWDVEHGADAPRLVSAL